MSTDSDELRARILARVAREPARTRPEGRKRALLLYTVAAVVVAAIFQAAGGFAHAAGRPASVSIPILIGEAVIALLATWAVLGRGRSSTGRPAGPLLVAAAAVPAVVFPWLTLWHGSYEEPFQRAGLACMALTLAMAGALITAIFLIRRRSDATHPAAQGAAVGAVCGAWADMVVDAWCPLTNVRHVLLGHVAPIAMMIGIGYVAGRVLLRVKAR